MNMFSTLPRYELMIMQYLFDIEEDCFVSIMDLYVRKHDLKVGNGADLLVACEGLYKKGLIEVKASGEFIPDDIPFCKIDPEPAPEPADDDYWDNTPYGDDLSQVMIKRTEKGRSTKSLSDYADYMKAKHDE